MSRDDRSGAPHAAHPSLQPSTRRDARPQDALIGAAILSRLFAIVGASGFAGLAYEVVWTRMLAASLGTETLAALGVVTGFFAGLGLGAFALDRVLTRTARPQRAYALLELAIGLWALASIWLLPASGRWLAALLGPEPTGPLLWLAGFLLPALSLLPATACMGGTVIALERLLAPHHAQGRVVAAVYGANTTGAMLGCLASVFVLMPLFGLSGTLMGLASVNLACALAALTLPAGAPAARIAGPAAFGRARLLVMLAGSGLLGIALEALVIRLATQVLQNTIESFAVLLAAYLLGTALGGLGWQATRRRPGPGAVAILLTAAALATALTAALIIAFGPAVLAAGTSRGGEALIAAALFLLPTAAMGALFGCLAQAWRDGGGALGVAFGVNATGAAIAPPLASLVLVPTLGAVAGMLAVALGFLLLLPRHRAAFSAAAPAALVLALAIGAPSPSLVKIPPGGQLLASREGPTATASVVADASGARYLEINGTFRMGGTGSRRSDWRQAQIPLLLHPAPHRALFLGVGTGATVAGAAAWPSLSVTGVELVPEAVALLPWFNDGAPPPIVLADARRFVQAERQRYDVIVADLFHPALDGSGALYTAEHFAAIRDRLAPGGVFCQWLPLYQLDAPSLDAIIRAFRTVFPGAAAWLAHLSLQTPMLALVGAPEGLAADPDRIARTLADPALQPALRQTGLLRPIDLLGLYVGGPAALTALAGAGPVNTDDHPFVALDAARNVRALAAPPTALLEHVLARTATSAGSPPGASAWNARLTAYRQARDRFIETGAAIPADAAPRDFMNAAIPGLLAALALSPEFDPAYDPLVAMAASLLGPDADRDDRAAAIRILHAAQQAAPARTEAPRLLTRLGQ